MEGSTFSGLGRVQSPGQGIADVHSAWAMDPSPQNSSLLLKHLEPTIQKAVTTYVGQTSSPTIKSRAKLMALDAASKYQPTAGAALPTHVFSQLQGLKRYASREGMVVSVPERLMLNKKKLDIAHQEFRDEMGRDPSDDELSYRAGVSLRDIKRVRKTPAVVNEGRFYQGQGTEESTPDLPAVVADNQGAEAWRDYIYHNSAETDKVIMEHTLGLNHKPKLDNTAIAAKLRMSPSAVSQRKNALQKQLDEYATLRPW
jgi:DNA-directed RNA polymerase specialized sigma subunit